MFRCPECGYDFEAITGVGFSFPQVYAETVSKMKSGELGGEAQRFFTEHPDGAICCDYVVMRCENCGEYDSRESLAMYVPDGKIYAEYPHKCRRCGGNLKAAEIFSEDEYGDETLIRPVMCPHCGREMEEAASILWD